MTHLNFLSEKLAGSPIPSSDGYTELYPAWETAVHPPHCINAPDLLPLFYQTKQDGGPGFIKILPKGRVWGRNGRSSTPPMNFYRKSHMNSGLCLKNIPGIKRQSGFPI